MRITKKTKQRENTTWTKLKEWEKKKEMRQPQKL